MANKSPVSAAVAAEKRKEGPTTAINTVRRDSTKSDHVPGDQTFHRPQGTPTDFRNNLDVAVDQQVPTGQPAYPAPEA